MSSLCYSVLFGQRKQKRRRRIASCCPTRRPSHQENVWKVQDTLLIKEESTPDGKSGVKQPLSGQKRKEENCGSGWRRWTLIPQDESRLKKGYSRVVLSRVTQDKSDLEGYRKTELSPRITQDESESERDIGFGWRRWSLIPQEESDLKGYSRVVLSRITQDKSDLERDSGLDETSEMPSMEEPIWQERKRYGVVMKENHKRDLSYEQLWAAAIQFVNDVFRIRWSERGPYYTCVDTYDSFECYLSEAEVELVKGHPDVVEVREQEHVICRFAGVGGFDG